jgi:hypothetical protein
LLEHRCPSIDQLLAFFKRQKVFNHIHWRRVVDFLQVGKRLERLQVSLIVLHFYKLDSMNCATNEIEFD